MKLNVEFENKNETSVETLDATRMVLQELIDLLDQNFSVCDLDTSTFITSENAPPSPSLETNNAQVYSPTEENLEEERCWSREVTPESSPPNSPRNSDVVLGYQ